MREPQPERGWRRAVPVLIVYAALAIAIAGLCARYSAVVVSGGSMRPVLRHGDLVFVRRGARPKVRDIVLADEPMRSPVLHRVVARHPDGTLTTQGDANPIADRESVRDEHVRGVVAWCLPLGVLLERWRAQ